MMLINQEFEPSVEETILSPIYECKSGKEIHYGLMVLIELAENHYSGGCSLAFISKKHSFPLSALIPIIYKLKETGLIDYRVHDPNWMFLKKEPQGNWILEVVSILKDLYL